jgi:hypothetical protein
VNILGFPLASITPLFPNQMITSHLFGALPRRSAVPGFVVEVVRFGAFHVGFDGHDFIVYVAQVGAPS